LPFSVLTLVFTFLIAGQAFQIQVDLAQTSSVTYAYSRITDAGFHQALWYVFIVSAISLLLACVAPGYKQPLPSAYVNRFTPSRLFYALILLGESLVAGILIFGVVGVSAFLNASRPGNQPGATLFIVLMSIGLFPLLFKIIYKQKVQIGDLLCLGLSLFVTAGFSRLHVILYSFVILAALYYGRGWAAKPFSIRMGLLFVVAGTVLALFFFTLGALRDAQNFTRGSLRDLINYNLDHPEKSLLSIEYTYRVNIEGMSGIAGAISEAIEYPGKVQPDFGVSTGMDGIAQILPAFVKQIFHDEMETVTSWYWYQKPGGNVSPGIETAFVSFGWIGAILYPCIIFLFGWIVPMKLLEIRLAPPLLLTCYLAIGCEILAIRGKWPDWIAFSLAYAIIIVFVWPLFSMCFSRVRSVEV
jgi:hypothetical protein